MAKPINSTAGKAAAKRGASKMATLQANLKKLQKQIEDMKNKSRVNPNVEAAKMLHPDQYATAALVNASKGTGISDRTLKKLAKTEKKIQTQVQTGKTQRTAAKAAAFSSAAGNVANARIEESKAQLSASQAREAQMQAYANLINGGTTQKSNPVNPNDESEGQGTYATDSIS